MEGRAEDERIQSLILLCNEDVHERNRLELVLASSSLSVMQSKVKDLFTKKRRLGSDGIILINV